jgi:hypothetical protein
MSIRPFLPVQAAAALALLLAVSGCSGGGGDATSAGTPAGSPTASATSSPDGEPAVSSADAAFAAMQDYNRRNNALIRKVRKPPYDLEPWKQVDGGSLLALDAFDMRALEKGYPYEGNRWRWTAPVQVYAPASKTWPKEFVAAASSMPVKPGRKQSKPGRKTVSLAVLQQATAGAPWTQVAHAPADAKRLPAAAGFGQESVPTDDQRAQALELAQQVPAYWRTGKAPAGFANTKFIDAPGKHRAESMRRGIYRDITYTARLFGGPASVRTYRVSGGAVALASYRMQITWIAERTIYWLDRAAAVWGTQPRPRLTETEVADVSYFIPDAGPAQPLGCEWNLALY